MKSPMKKQNVLITGATGGMGFETLKQMLEDKDQFNILAIVRKSEKNRKLLKPYESHRGFKIYWGDLTDYRDVYQCVKDADIILHIAAFVSPAADYNPKKAMKINFGSTKNLIDAVKEQNRQNEVKFVYIGTVAETGDRMPPIHWGRVGDPVKPSIFDYYAVSKVAAERYVIESELRYWVSLRQTGIIGNAMAGIVDAIMFHNCLDNVLEYVSVRDSGRMMKHLCAYTADDTLEEVFWGHIYNVGGGDCCRVSTNEMYQALYGSLGFTNLDYVIDPKLYAIRNFHGHYYLDSDKLEAYLHFRSDSMQYFYEAYRKKLRGAVPILKVICNIPGGQKLIGTILKRGFLKQARTEHGTLHFIEANMEEQIEAYWGSKQAWDAIPGKLSQMKHFTKWDEVIWLDHGYDESKPECGLSLDDMKKAAEFRGGKCLAVGMAAGDWRSKLKFQCAYGHVFEASPRLVLEGGHWCPECERKSWNYAERAKGDTFFAQVWIPLHGEEELRAYRKVVSEEEYL